MDSASEDDAQLPMLYPHSVEFGHDDSSADSTSPDLVESDLARSAEIHQLYVLHYGALLSFISRRIANPDDASDLAQTAFAEAFQSYGKFSGKSSMKTWLFGIAINVMRNHYYRSSWRHVSSMDDADLAAVMGATPSAQQTYESRLAAHHALCGLSAAAPEHRETLLMVVWDGLSYEDAAERLGVAIGTVRSRVSRLRAALRRECDWP
jgi:RNA polymerase sigma factor (sigma-70 family)